MTERPGRKSSEDPASAASPSSSPSAEPTENLSPASETQSASTAEPPERPLTQAEQLARVDDLLSGKLRTEPAQAQAEAASALSGAEAEDAGEEAGAASGGAPASDENEEGEEPRNFTREAVKERVEKAFKDGMTPAQMFEELGIPPETAYSLSVPVGDDGGTVTVGELKDFYRGHVEAERELEERTSAVDAREAEADEMFQFASFAAQELQQGRQVTEQTLHRFRELKEAELAREAQLMRAHVPALQDDATRDAFRERVVKFAGRFGMRPEQVVITNHVFVRMLDYMFKLEDREARSEARKRAKPVPKPNPPKASMSKPKGTSRPNGAAMSESQKASRVANIIGG